MKLFDFAPVLPIISHEKFENTKTVNRRGTDNTMGK